MKRILSLFLALTLVFALVACSNEKNTSSDIDTSTHNTTQSDTESTDDTSTESNESNITDENSSITETPSNSKPTNTETSKPTTNSNNNTQTSKPTESSKPTQSTTGNNSSNNNNNNNSNNSNNNSNNSNNNSNNSTTTPPESKPEEIEYYNENRVVDRKLTKTTLTNNINSFMNNNQTAKLEDFASSFSDFDVFGYALTKDEILNKNYVSVMSQKTENNQTVITLPSEYRITLRFKTVEEVVRAIKRDIKKYYEYVGNSQNVTIRYNSDPNDNIGNITTVNTLNEVPDNIIQIIASGKYLNNAYIQCQISYLTKLQISCYEDGNGGILYWLDFRMD